jgi:hypothetical protein
MMRRKRLPEPGERVKVGRRSFTVPGVRSMTDPNPLASATKSGAGEPEWGTVLFRVVLPGVVKAAYQ